MTDARTGIPFVMTRAMKEALRSRGLSDDDIAEMTPVEAHKLLAPDRPDPSVIEAFRCRVLRAGFSPLPLVGKQPVLKNWQHHDGVSELEIGSWTKNAIRRRATPAF